MVLQGRMLALFDGFSRLDPLLQVLAIVAVVAFVLIAGIRLRIYLRKRRNRKRRGGWVAY
jgi:hypothetical protein